MRTVLTLAAASLWVVLATPVASDTTCPARYPPLPPSRPAPTHVVPILLADYNLIASVDVYLGDEKVRMIIDTGSTCIIITRSVAKALLASGAAYESGTLRSQMADGTISVRRQIIIRKVTIGDRMARNVNAIVETDTSPMAIGFPVLNQLGRFTIDTKTKQLILG
jgi:clan AA aspartic protease (TIGR02281 family)